MASDHEWARQRASHSDPPARIRRHVRPTVTDVRRVVTPTFATSRDLEARIQRTALKRHGLSEELGSTVAFLAARHGGYITGEVIQFDGGMTVSLV